MKLLLNVKKNAFCFILSKQAVDMHHLVTLELDGTDKTTHSWCVVIAQLTLHPHLLMSRVCIGLAAYDIWSRPRLAGRGVSVSRSHMSFDLRTGGGGMTRHDIVSFYLQKG